MDIQKNRFYFIEIKTIKCRGHKESESENKAGERKKKDPTGKIKDYIFIKPYFLARAPI